MEIIPLWYNPQTQKYRYARTATAEENKSVAEAVQARIAREFPNVQGLKGYFKHDSETGVNRGSSTFIGILVNQEWMKRSTGALWVPSVAEYKALERAGKLSNDVYRDIGIVAYTAGSPNKEIAESLISQAQGKHNVPIVVPSFKALGTPTIAENSYGLDIPLSGDTSEVVSGKKGQEFLEAIFPNRVGNSGVRRLSRNRNGWDADWGDGLGDSVGSGRVGDFVCGEATAENLGQMVMDIDNAQIEMLRKTQKQRIDAFNQSLGALKR
jgi:hypothetical protein